MTTFDRAQFHYWGGYLSYGPERRFVARFKYQPQRRGRFITFLVKHFTVEEYFAALDAGSPPIAILTSKGFDPLTQPQRARLHAQLAAMGRA